MAKPVSFKPGVLSMWMIWMSHGNQGARGWSHIAQSPPRKCSC